jgi:hypothetical protein
VWQGGDLGSGRGQRRPDGAAAPRLRRSRGRWCSPPAPARLTVRTALLGPRPVGPASAPETGTGTRRR